MDVDFGTDRTALSLTSTKEIEAAHAAYTEEAAAYLRHGHEYPNGDVIEALSSALAEGLTEQRLVGTHLADLMLTQNTLRTFAHSTPRALEGQASVEATTRRQELGLQAGKMATQLGFDIRFKGIIDALLMNSADWPPLET